MHFDLLKDRRGSFSSDLTGGSGDPRTRVAAIVKMCKLSSPWVLAVFLLLFGYYNLRLLTQLETCHPDNCSPSPSAHHHHHLQQQQQQQEELQQSSSPPPANQPTGLPEPTTPPKPSTTEEQSTLDPRLQQQIKEFAEFGVKPCLYERDNIIRNSDLNREKRYSQYWARLTPSMLKERRELWQSYISRVPAAPPKGFFSGRGIVLTAGNRDTLSRAKTAIQFLRYHGCKLPIEIWHFTGEIPENEIKSMTNTKLHFRDITDPNLILPVPGATRSASEKNFHIKAASIINSKFAEVLYIDSDNIPLLDPTTLFETPDFTETGAIFWPDFWKTHPDNPIWKIMGVDCVDEWEQEAGQIVVDKIRHWRALHLAHYLNVNFEFYFHLINGDKDTFRFAWKALNASMAWPKRYLATGGFEYQGRFCGHTMVQPDLPSQKEVQDAITREGDRRGLDLNPPLRYMFAHANLLKDIPNYVLQYTPFQVLKRYKADAQAVFLTPTFYMTGEPNPIGGCIDYLEGSGEPEVIEEEWELRWFENFNSLYFKMGGVGGGGAGGAGIGINGPIVGREGMRPLPPPIREEDYYDAPLDKDDVVID